MQENIKVTADTSDALQKMDALFAKMKKSQADVAAMRKEAAAIGKDTGIVAQTASLEQMRMAVELTRTAYRYLQEGAEQAAQKGVEGAAEIAAELNSIGPALDRLQEKIATSFLGKAAGVITQGWASLLNSITDATEQAQKFNEKLAETTALTIAAQEAQRRLADEIKAGQEGAKEGTADAENRAAIRRETELPFLTGEEKASRAYEIEQERRQAVRKLRDDQNTRERDLLLQQRQQIFKEGTETGTLTPEQMKQREAIAGNIDKLESEQKANLAKDRREDELLKARTETERKQARLEAEKEAQKRREDAERDAARAMQKKFGGDLSVDVESLGFYPVGSQGTPGGSGGKPSGFSRLDAFAKMQLREKDKLEKEIRELEMELNRTASKDVSERIRRLKEKLKQEREG